jgi:hypothetical protein
LRVISTPQGVRSISRVECAVRIDAHNAAEAKRRLVRAPVKIEPPGIRVDLDCDAVLGACDQNFFNVDLVAAPPQQLPPDPLSSYVSGATIAVTGGKPIL